VFIRVPGGARAMSAWVPLKSDGVFVSKKKSSDSKIIARVTPGDQAIITRSLFQLVDPKSIAQAPLVFK
jgi:hypothetical protein